MSNESQEGKQKTPKGYEIPVPKRKSVLDAFKKVAVLKADSTSEPQPPRQDPAD